MEPQMGGKKKHFIEETLLSFAAQSGRPISVLEWGSGGSTVYFTRFLRDRNIPFKWVSLEYDPVWYEKVQTKISDNLDVSLVLFDTKGRDPRRKDVSMDEYVYYPNTLGMRFDLIIIDGRKRSRCLTEAFSLVKENGIVLLDDAFRTRYWSALRRYPQGHFMFDSLWVGSISSPTFTRALLDMLNKYAYTLYFIGRWLKRYLREKLPHR